MKNSLKILAIISSTAALITAMGIGCGVAWQPVGLEGLKNISSGAGGLDAGDNGDLVVVSGQRTTSIAFYDQVYANLLSASGITTPRNQITNTYNDKVGSLSENGSVLTINAPMLLAFSAIGGEVCDQIIDEERGLAAADRKIFGAMFQRNNIGALTEDDLKDTTRRLARTFWQRNESGTEMQILLQGADQMISQNTAGNNAGAEVDKAALFLCTSVIASASTYEM